MRGQASAEFLIVLGISLTILLMVFILSNQQRETVISSEADLQTHRTLSDLATAAREVYAQGRGATKFLTVTLPKSYNVSASNISSYNIVLHVGKTDYVAVTTFLLQGNPPATGGTTQVTVQNAGNTVVFGTAIASANRSAVSAAVANGTAYGEMVNVTNLENATLSVTVGATWTNGSANLSWDKSSLSIPAYASDNVTLTFQTSAAAVGTFAGQLNITASDATTTQTILIPLSVDSVRIP